MAAKVALAHFLLLLSYFSVAALTLVDGQKTWCVAKPSSDNAILQQNINFACSNVDCTSFFREGCPCFSPNNLINRASIAMNLYYRNKGANPWNCHFSNSALVVLTDPSYGSCVYA